MEMDYFRRLFLFSFSPKTFCCIYFISSNFLTFRSHFLFYFWLFLYNHVLFV